MKKPKKLSGEQGKYIEYLENKLLAFSAVNTTTTSYLALRKTIGDINKLLIEGMTVISDDTGDSTIVPIVSSEALSSKDEKTFERIFKFIDKLGFYNSELKVLGEEISPEIKDNVNYASEYEEIQSLIGK